MRRVLIASGYSGPTKTKKWVIEFSRLLPGSNEPGFFLQSDSRQSYFHFFEIMPFAASSVSLFRRVQPLPNLSQCDRLS